MFEAALFYGAILALIFFGAGFAIGERMGTKETERRWSEAVARSAAQRAEEAVRKLERNLS